MQALDPGVALRPGRGDPTALLVLWLVRQAFVPLVLLGILVVVITGTDEPTELGSADELARNLLTPLAPLVVAVVSRIAVAGAAFALAYPLSRWTRPDQYPDRSGLRLQLRLWTDRLHLTRAYRSLRWTWPVRQRAVTELGPRGARLVALEGSLRWISVALVALVLVAAALT